MPIWNGCENCYFWKKIFNMKSPFPGMDPWLEGHVWPDVHHDLATKFKEQIIPQVVPNYFVRIETYTVEDKNPEEEVGIMYPDVEILKRKAEPVHPVQEEGGVATLTPATLVIPRPVIEVHIPVVEIRDIENRQLVTAIEILSPVNKRGKGLKNYREKCELLHNDGVHLLEVDLLRRGTRTLEYPLPDEAHYVVMLTRGDKSKTEVWAMTVRDKLPIVPIPLKKPDPDVRLDIAAAFHEVYDRSRYELSVRYDAVPPIPAFQDEDLKWLQGVLKTHKLVK